MTRERIRCHDGHAFTPDNTRYRITAAGKSIRICLTCEARRKLYPRRAPVADIGRAYEFDLWTDDDGHMLIRTAPDRFETTAMDARYRAARRRLLQHFEEIGVDPALATFVEVESMREYDYANVDWITVTVYRTVLPIRPAEEEATG